MIELFGSWEEVFSSIDLGEVMRRENILSDNGIKYKTKVTNNSLRLGMGSMGGSAAASVSRSNPVPETYRILVLKECLETAQYHLQKACQISD